MITGGEVFPSKKHHVKGAFNNQIVPNLNGARTQI
tara:strand:- start:5 stop:109 length:105 start_codon:yes stop_codon:yes gene_type:complete